MNAQDTSAEPTPDLQLEIAHLLLIDVVGYSKLLVNEQIEVLQNLNQIVRTTECFRAAEASDKLMRVPTGDGMALLFFRSPEEPVRCALEISKTLKGHSQFQVRMGVHSGPVNRVTDVNDKTNIAGSGINIAQRVLDCGDAGHILLSAHIAEDLVHYRHWQPYLHDIGECEVKHGRRLHLFNLYKDNLGNRQLPEKLKGGKRRRPETAWSRPSSAPRWPKVALTVALLVLTSALIVSSLIYFQRPSPRKIISSAAEPTGSVTVPTPEKSVAVLPFENFSDEKKNAYFADGIQDEILTDLARVADLKVISRTSVMQYKNAVNRNLREIAQQLGVAHVLEGSVQRTGNRVRVTAQLIDARTDTHLWAESYDRDLADVFAIQSEIAKTIADQLQAKISPSEKAAIEKAPTTDLVAYDLYLRAQALFADTSDPIHIREKLPQAAHDAYPRGLAHTLNAGNNPAGVLAAQKYLREAVRLDPKFALSWALLSNVDALGYLVGSLQPTVALREEARQAAETALTLQPNLGEAILAKGYYYYACLKDYDAALRYFEQARHFLPNSSRIPMSLALVARRQGKWDRSESYFNEAERLDPHNVWLLTNHAFSYSVLRRFPEALRKFDQVLDIMPGDLDTLAFKAAIAQAEGDLPRAAALLAPLRPTADHTSALETQIYQAILERRTAQIISRLKEILAKPDPALGYHNGGLRFWLGWAQDIAGDHAAAQESWRQARSELESFLTEQPENYSLIGDLALTNMGLGDKAAALALSERGIAALPIEKDVVTGAAPIETLARVAAQTGEPDRAILALQQVLSIPGTGALDKYMPLTPALLRLDPMFDPLRNDARFQKLVARPAPK